MKGGYVVPHRRGKGKKLSSSERKRAKTRRTSKLLQRIQSLNRKSIRARKTRRNR